MKGKLLLLCIALLPCVIHAQKLKVKNGKIALDKTLIATYDGSGGLIKNFDLTVSSVANKPLIRLTEKEANLQHPFRPNGARWLDITFMGSTQRTMQYHFPNDQRTWEREVMAFLFNDTTKLLIQSDSLDEASVTSFIANHNYDLNADTLAIRSYEAENAKRIADKLSRDPSKPVLMPLISTEEIGGETVSTYKIYQDDIFIGKVEKRMTSGTMPNAYYIIWKRVLTPYTYNGKEMEVAPLAFLKSTSNAGNNILILMTDKTKWYLSTKDYTQMQRQLVDLLVSKGLL